MTNVLGTDLSFYQDNDDTPEIVVDFVRMRQAGAGFTIIRAGQRNWIDPDFFTHWENSRAAGIPRGSYWYYDSREAPLKQAELWAGALGNDLGELPLFADFEEKYKGPFEGWDKWKIFLERLGQLVGSHEIAIYTNYYYWHESVPVARQDSFHIYPLWIATYGEEPMVPSPWEEGEWLFWQYTDKGNGRLYGAESTRIDLNYFNGDQAAFNKRFKLNITDPPAPLPPAGDIMAPTHKGVVIHRIERFGCKCIVHVIDTKVARLYVTPGGFQTVGAAVEKYGSQGGVNGGGWPNVQTPGHRSNEIWASDGEILQATAIDGRPFINVAADGSVIIHESPAHAEPLWNAWGMDRILGKDWEFNSRISDRTTKDARTGSGVTADGKLVLLSAEGDDRYKKGLTFPEMWSVLSEFGSVIAGNNDGGSSSTVINKVVLDESLIKPSDGQQARVINQVLFFAKGVDGPLDPPTIPDPPDTGEPPMSDTYRVIFPIKPRPKPEIAGGNKPNIPAGFFFVSDVVVPGLPAGTIFVQMPDGDYIPLVYAGTEYVQKIVDAPASQPESPIVSIMLIREDGSSEEWVRKP